MTSGLSARFELPEKFCEAHAFELLTWAKDLQAYGPLLKIKLKRAPVGEFVSVLAGLLPVDVTLKCTLLKRQSDDEAVFKIEPNTTYDGEMIGIYVHELPAIEKARMAFIEREAAKRGRKPIAAVVEGVPDCFVEAYMPELMRWGQRFGKSGAATTIVLREIPGAPVKLDDWGNKPMLAVELVAEREDPRAERSRLLIKPADETSAALIARHSEDIVRYGQPIMRRAH